MPGAISAIYAALAGLLVLGLAANVSVRRRGLGIGLGTGDVPVLTVAVRAHANAVETLPLALVLLLLLEINGAPATWVHVLGAVLLAGRVGHAEGLLRHGGGVSVGRFYGTLATWAMMLASALGLLVLLLL
jgi:uncharacterized membrane protein YecN with MAPEG domain